MPKIESKTTDNKKTIQLINSSHLIQFSLALNKYFNKHFNN